MNEWKNGRFERHRIRRVYHRFTPAHAAESLLAVDLNALWKQGKRLLLLDVDNTLVQWHAQECSETILKWTQDAKALGFEICIISNTTHDVPRNFRLGQYELGTKS